MSDSNNSELRNRVLGWVQAQNIAYPDHSNEIDQEATDSLMALITKELVAAETVGTIQGVEFANNVLYDNCPTGDVKAWDMLMAVQKTQGQLDAFIGLLKNPPSFTPPTNETERTA